MRQNIGITDKLIRMIATLILVVMYYTQVVTGEFVIPLIVAAVALAISSYASFCPLYGILGISTKHDESGTC